MNYETCKIQWSINVTEIIEDFAPLTSTQALTTSPVSRTSPQFGQDDILYFGTQTHALMVAIDRLTGKTLGVAQINPHPLACLTMSPTVANVTDDNDNPVQEVIFIGAASQEEVASDQIPGYMCCSFVSCTPC
jgi:hypothetical protein